MTLGEIQERLIAWAGAQERQPWLLAARASWFSRVGEPHDEDKSYEQRMNGLLEHYVFEWKPDGVRTTLELFLRDGAEGLTTDERGQVRDLGRSLRSLFEVRKIGDGAVELEDVLGDGRHTVVERRAVVALAKGDLLEARLLPHDGKLHFSSASTYHPREVRKAILKEARRLQGTPGWGRAGVEEFLAQLSRMALSFERYRNVRVESIYDFEARPARSAEG
ncbi:MAG TPA: hypothetical protein PLL32_04245 [Anaeromyxobacteraceae bacterium]|nr:hypothetical protein [Anaeromyxobacteraceae bacterium]